jgi:hypothetical protein
MRGDATSRWEEMIDEVAKGLDDWAASALADVLPRPPGAERLNAEEAHRRWLALKDDVQALTTMLQQRAQVLGPTRAALEMLLWDKRHRAMEKGADNGSEERQDSYDSASEEGAEANNLP